MNTTRDTAPADNKPLFINYRPLVFVTVSFLIGVTAGGIIYNNTILVFLLPAIGILAGILFYFFLKKKIVLLLTLFCALGIIAFCADYRINFSGNIHSEKVYSTFRVCENKKEYLIVEDLIFDSKKYKGRAVLRLSDCKGYEAGDIVTLHTDISTYDFNIFSSYSMSLYGDKIYYELRQNGQVKKEQGALKTFEKLKKSIIYHIFENMPDSEAGVTVSLVFGDKNYLSMIDSETIRGVGLSHIFAVSGLHIGFLTALVVFLCKKLRILPLYRLFVVVFSLFAYGMLTGFPPGVKRAAIMSVIYMLSIILGRKNDNLTTLSLSALIIVMTNPRELFDIGFLMSLSAVLGIICFYKQVNYFLYKKIKGRPRKFLSASFATTFSANVFLMPICFNIFNSAAVYMFLSNLIVLPVVTVSYFIVMAVLLLSLIWGGFGILYKIASLPISFIRILSAFIYKMPYAVINVKSMGVFTVFYLAAAVLMSKYILLDKNKKYKISCALILSGAFLMLIF